MSLSSQTGRLYGIGIGPGDPELLTIKALRILQAVPVVAYPISEKQQPLARSIIAPYLTGSQIEVPMFFPFKLEESAQPYYDSAAAKLAEYLDAGQDVVVLCEGDPFFYGSFMYLYTRLVYKYQVEVVPGVSSIMASASALGAPLTYRNDVFMVLSSILSAEVLTEKLAVADAAVIIKLGKHFRKVYGVLKDLGLLERAKYIERATTSNQVIMPLEKVDPDAVPYFSLILIPSQWQP
ncbi:MAG: precorrin-2 C(20)-methyltransferase [Calothrix sp. C42_A2020_038]|nr:precorrin-2 C(20)-methyltransferase [Calothrix sp. C42_A2020_038]